MSGPQDESEKIFEPTPRKLDQARRKGEIAKSMDISVTASYLGFLLILSVSGAASVSQVGTMFSVLLEQAHAIAPLVFEGDPSTPIGGMMTALVMALAPWLIFPAIVVVASILAQRAFVFTPSKLALKANRVSVVQNAKNKFGRSGLFEFAKSFVKLLLYSICLGVFLKLRMNEMTGSVHAEPAMAAATLARLLLEFLLIVTLVSGAIAAVDFLWQRQDYLRRNMMTRKEMTDETKEAEGDPHMKQQRRQKGQEIASAQMLADVATADVVIVNPTHYAVALTWSRMPGEAPVCVAKGVDEIAARIRERAQEFGIPIRQDPPTARALHATVKVGQEIPVDLYRPVATAIRFAELMRKKAKGLA